VEKKEEVDSESEEEDEDDVELDLKNLCSEVAAILRKDAVSLKNVLPQTGISKRLVGSYFLYHDGVDNGDHSMQLVQIKKVYSGKRRGKFNVEVKFHNQNGRQDMKLEDSNYDRELRSVKSWVLLGTD
jgi:hypothetical protein